MDISRLDLNLLVVFHHLLLTSVGRSTWFPSTVDLELFLVASAIEHGVSYGSFGKVFQGAL